MKRVVDWYLGAYTKRDRRRKCRRICSTNWVQNSPTCSSVLGAFSMTHRCVHVENGWHCKNSCDLGHCMLAAMIIKVLWSWHLNTLTLHTIFLHHKTFCMCTFFLRANNQCGKRNASYAFKCKRTLGQWRCRSTSIKFAFFWKRFHAHKSLAQLITREC